MRDHTLTLTSLALCLPHPYPTSLPHPSLPHPLIRTIIDYASVIVMHHAQLVEQGQPAALLDDPSSALSSMATALGGHAKSALRRKSLRGADGGAAKAARAALDDLEA